MKSAKKFICILTALMLICAMALPAFAEGETQYNEHDVAKLRAFFEQESPDGVKNGDVLFENYDPDDPATWDAYMEFADDDIHAVEWDENGRSGASVSGSRIRPFTARWTFPAWRSLRCWNAVCAISPPLTAPAVQSSLPLSFPRTR